MLVSGTIHSNFRIEICFMPESDFLKWTNYLKVSQQALGIEFIRTMVDTKLHFVYTP